MLLLHERKATLLVGGVSYSTSLPLGWQEGPEVPGAVKGAVKQLFARARLSPSVGVRVLIFPETFQLFTDINEYHAPRKEDLEKVGRDSFSRFFPNLAPEELRFAYSFALEGTYVSAVPLHVLKGIGGCFPNPKSFYSGTLSLASAVERLAPEGGARVFAFYIDGGTALGVYLIRGRVARIVRLSSLEKVTPGEQLPVEQIQECASSLEAELGPFIGEAHGVEFVLTGSWAEEVLGRLRFSPRYALIGEGELWGAWRASDSLLYVHISGGGGRRLGGSQALALLGGALGAAFIAYNLFLTLEVGRNERLLSDLDARYRNMKALESEVQRLREEVRNLQRGKEEIEKYPYPKAYVLLVLEAIERSRLEVKFTSVSLTPQSASLSIAFTPQNVPSFKPLVESLSQLGFEVGIGDLEVSEGGGKLSLSLGKGGEREGVAPAAPPSGPPEGGEP